MNPSEVDVLNWSAAGIICISSLWLWPKAVASARNIYSLMRHNKPIKESDEYVA